MRVRLIDGLNCTPVLFREKLSSRKLTVPVLETIDLLRQEALRREGVQGLEAHGPISPNEFYGEKLWCPGLRSRESVELSNCSTSVQSLGDADHPPVVVQVVLAWGASPSAACCVQVVALLEMCEAKMSKRLFTISGETVNTCSGLHVREMPAPHAQRLPRLTTFSGGRY